MPIPSIPPKQNFGNTDLVFIQQRRYYLERFLRGLAKHEFIINSQEFRCFSRPSGMSIEKSLGALVKLRVTETYDRIKEAT